MIKEYFNLSKSVEIISFSQIPFQTLTLDGKLFNGFGISRLSGVVLTYYYDEGRPFLKIGKAMRCMHSSALSTYETLVARSIKEIQVAFIPLPPEQIDLFAKGVYLGYLEQTITNAHELLTPWITAEKQCIPPYDLFNFRTPFFEKKWNFWDYKDRMGVYLVEEDGIIVYVGFATNVGNRPRSHFYPTAEDRPTPHKRLQYWKNIEHKTYRLAIIDCSPKGFSNFVDYLKAVVNLEKLLIKLFNPRDNERGKGKEKIIIQPWKGFVSTDEPDPF